MSDKRNLADYVDVATRIQRFYEKHPEGSLRSEILHHDKERVLIRAFAYRTPDDPAPATGHAEEVRSMGPVNRTSAVENCETSAWGRAIAALGFEVKSGIASREEMDKAAAEERYNEARIDSHAMGRLRDQFDDACPPEDSDLRESFVAAFKAKLHSFGIEAESVNDGLARLLPSQAAEMSAWLAEAPEAEETKREILAAYDELRQVDGRKLPKGKLDAMLAAASSNEDLAKVSAHVRELIEKARA